MHRVAASLLLGVVYAAAASLAVLSAVLAAPHLEHPLLVAAVADLVATSVVFACSWLLDNGSVYDPYWSVAPVPIAFGLWWAGGDALDARDVIVLGLVTAWGVRLTVNFLLGWRGLGHEDWRYRRLRDQTGRAWWLVAFLGTHLMPTVVVFLGCLPLWPALISDAPLGPLQILAALATGGAIVIEAVADAQLRRFVARGPDREQILDEGLWHYSRHPNYFGEIAFWWGLWALGTAAEPAWAWTAIGPASITALFWFVSIPMMERRMLARRPLYAVHQREVARLVPLPRFDEK